MARLPQPSQDGKPLRLAGSGPGAGQATDRLAPQREGDRWTRRRGLAALEQRVAALEAIYRVEEHRKREDSLGMARLFHEALIDLELGTRPAAGDGTLLTEAKGTLRSALPVGFAAERLHVDDEQVDESVELPRKVEEREPHRLRITELVLERLERREDGAVRETLGPVQRFAERVVAHERVGSDPLRASAKRLWWLRTVVLIVRHGRSLSRQLKRVKRRRSPWL